MHVLAEDMLACEHMSIAVSKFHFRREIRGTEASDELAAAAPKIDRARNGIFAGQKHNNQPNIRL